MEIDSHWSNLQWISTGWDNDLAPVSPQAIIWTNDGLSYWRIHAQLGLNKLKQAFIKTDEVVANMEQLDLSI